MKFRYTILYVDSVEQTLDFYHRAFGLDARLLHESGDYGELDTGHTKLSFSSRELMATLGKNPGVADRTAPTFEIAFETDDVQRCYDKAVAAGATPVQAPRDEPWGQTTSYVADPNNILVEICSPVRAADS